jgi:hypothetical protein
MFSSDTLAMSSFLWISLALGTHSTSDHVFSPQVLDHIQAQLSDTCGSPCIELFNDILPLVSNITTPEDDEDAKEKFSHFNEFIDKVLSRSREENERIVNEISSITASSFARKQPGSVSPHQPPPSQPGLPCSTQAECTSMLYRINRCSHIRKGAADAYAGANAAVNVMANLISVLCGCIFAGPLRICVLRGIPYTCGFPFMAYVGLYGVSSALWSAVTKTSVVCSVVGSDQLV